MQLSEFVEITEFLSILNGRLSAAINRQLNRKFKAEGLDITTEQWSVLACIWNQDRLTQQEISDLTFKDKASITRLLDTLSKHNLVVRVSDPKDRRINLIHLTKAGIEMEQKAMAIVQDSFKMAIADIAPNDLLYTKNILYKLLNNILQQ